MDFMQILMIGLVVAVWILIYNIWREVDVFILIQQNGESPSKNLEEIIARSKENSKIKIKIRANDDEGLLP